MSEHNQVMAQRLWDLSDAATPGTKAYRQRLRDQAAVAAMQGMLANPYAVRGLPANLSPVKEITRASLRYADALVAALYPEEGTDED